MAQIGSSTSITQVTGGCLCGAVRISISDRPSRVAVCHCMDCRKHHGSVFYAAAVFPKAAVSVNGATGVWKERHFCPICGSSVFAETETEIELYLGTLDAPDQFEPDYESWILHREKWLPEFDLHQRYISNRETDQE